jgi:hypothetical protein
VEKAAKTRCSWSPIAEPSTCWILRPTCRREARKPCGTPSRRSHPPLYPRHHRQPYKRPGTSRLKDRRQMPALRSQRPKPRREGHKGFSWGFLLDTVTTFLPVQLVVDPVHPSLPATPTTSTTMHRESRVASQSSASLSSRKTHERHSPSGRKQECHHAAQALFRATDGTGLRSNSRAAPQEIDRFLARLQ